MLSAQVSTQVQRPMHQLSMDEMRQAFAIIHGFLPDLDDCTYAVQATSCILQSGQLVLILEWYDALNICVGCVEKDVKQSQVLELDNEQQSAAIAYLATCNMAFSFPTTPDLIAQG